LIEEKHVPILQETHTYQSSKEEKDAIVHETFEKAQISETHAKPIVTEVVEKTIVHTDGSAKAGGLMQGELLGQAAMGANTGFNQTTTT